MKHYLTKDINGEMNMWEGRPKFWNKIEWLAGNNSVNWIMNGEIFKASKINPGEIYEIPKQKLKLIKK